MRSATALCLASLLFGAVHAAPTRRSQVITLSNGPSNNNSSQTQVNGKNVTQTQVNNNTNNNNNKNNSSSIDNTGLDSNLTASVNNPACMVAGGQTGPGLTAGGPGAAYWMSNEPNGNVSIFVFSANLDADGKMLFGMAAYAGGRGAHIGPDVNAPNALASQASVKVVKDKLVVVNAGSNTASVFQIDFQNPAFIRMIGQPVSSSGDFPVSSTIDKVTGNVCVLNGGQTNGVSCYSVDLKKGLVAIPNSIRSLNLKLTTPPQNEDNTPTQIVFADDGKRLFASVKGDGKTAGFIAAWEVNADGSLSANFTKNTPSGGQNPASLTFVRGADAIMNSDVTKGFSVFDFKNGGTQASSQINAIGGSKHTAWSEFSDATLNYYITDIDTDTLTEIAIDSKTLQSKVVKQYPQKKGSKSMDQEIALINAKDTMYILSPGSMTMETLSLVGPGDAQPKESFDLLAAAKTAGVFVSSANVQGVNAFFTG